MTLWQDVRYALRSLHRTPTVAAATVVTFAIGIGANTAVFSVVDAGTRCGRCGLPSPTGLW